MSYVPGMLAACTPRCTPSRHASRNRVPHPVLVEPICGLQTGCTGATVRPPACFLTEFSVAFVRLHAGGCWCPAAIKHLSPYGMMDRALASPCGLPPGLPLRPGAEALARHHPFLGRCSERRACPFVAKRSAVWRYRIRNPRERRGASNQSVVAVREVPVGRIRPAGARRGWSAGHGRSRGRSRCPSRRRSRCRRRRP